MKSGKRKPAVAAAGKVKTSAERQMINEVTLIAREPEFKCSVFCAVSGMRTGTGELGFL